MTNAATLLVTTARRYGDRPALRFGSLTRTYAELHSRAARLAGALQAQGLQPGDRVGLVQANSPTMVESIFGCLLGGFVVVPINARLAPTEVAYIASDCGARALIHDAGFNARLAGVAAAMPTVEQRICTAPSHGELSYECVLTEATPLETMAELDSEDTAWLFYTSGTTGRPKGAIWTHRLILELALRYLADISPVTADDVVLHIAPMSHGSVNALFSTIGKGGLTVMVEGKSFDPDTVYGLIQSQSVSNISFAAPTQLVKLVEHFRAGEHDLSSLRCIQYGGAPMYREQLLTAIAVFGPILVQIYGQAEVPMTITSLDQADHRRWRDGTDQRITSAGTCRTGMEVGTFDERGARLPDGEIGEIAVRGAMVTPGYWGNQDATANAHFGEWWRTGDIGQIDDQGYLYLLDRSNDMIISGGNNVYPREVEDALLTDVRVAECAVFGIPDPYWGEAVHAVVCLHEPGAATPEELITHVATQLAGYKKPKAIDLAAELPKNAYGKIVRRELREPFWADRATRVGGG